MTVRKIVKLAEEVKIGNKYIEIEYVGNEYLKLPDYKKICKISSIRYKSFELFKNRYPGKDNIYIFETENYYAFSNKGWVIELDIALTFPNFQDAINFIDTKLFKHPFYEKYNF